MIKGTRISVELVMDLLAAGYTAQQIIEQYDHLTAEDIQACLAYAKAVIRLSPPCGSRSSQQGRVAFHVLSQYLDQRSGRMRKRFRPSMRYVSKSS